MAQVRACAVQLNELNEGMLRRMDELYRTVKNNSIALTAVPAVSYTHLMPCGPLLTENRCDIITPIF